MATLIPPRQGTTDEHRCTQRDVTDIGVHLCSSVVSTLKNSEQELDRELDDAAAELCVRRPEVCVRQLPIIKRQVEPRVTVYEGVQRVVQEIISREAKLKLVVFVFADLEALEQGEVMVHEARPAEVREIGRASCRERVEISVA